MIRMLAKPRRRRRKIRTIGPQDNGRRMSLDDFDRAIGREGYLYELSKGVIEVTDVPQPSHGKQLQEIRLQLTAQQLAHPGAVHYMASGSDAKLLIAPSQSERHPDLSVYLTPAPNDTDEVWSIWVPAIVVEIVSKRSSKRDYQDKPSEYLEFGVDEYWIVDSTKRQMTALTRWRGQWKQQVIKPGKKHVTPLLLGFALDLKQVLNAAK